jgi:hypothetical protein
MDLIVEFLVDQREYVRYCLQKALLLPKEEEESGEL